MRPARRRSRPDPSPRRATSGRARENGGAASTRVDHGRRHRSGRPLRVIVTPIPSLCTLRGRRSRGRRRDARARRADRPRRGGLTGRTLGVIGYGRIGRDVVRLLAPWGMDVLVSAADAQCRGGRHVPLEALLAGLRRGRRRLQGDGRDARPARRAPVGADQADGLPGQRRAWRDRRPARARRGAARCTFTARASTSGKRSRRPRGRCAARQLPNVVGAPPRLGYTDELVRGCVEVGLGEALL